MTGLSSSKNRHSIRLQEYDYSSPGAYFVTICVHNLVRELGTVDGKQVALSPYGQRVIDGFEATQKHFQNISMPYWVIMPNHIHCVFEIWDMKGDHLTVDLAKVVAYFKYQTADQINRLKVTPGERFWQRNYYEHIIRNDTDYERIRKYIEANPASWVDDKLHPGASPNPFNRA